MFGFDEYEAEDLGSAGRYEARKERFIKDKKPLPRIRHGFWWFVHNCISHPVIGLVPIKVTFKFHDWTSKKLNHDQER